MSWGVAPGSPQRIRPVADFNEATPLALSVHEARGFTSDGANRFFAATAEMQSIP